MSKLGLMRRGELQVGDPFLGGLIKLVGKGIGGLAKKLGGKKKIMTTVSSAASGMLNKKVLKAGAAAVGTGAAIAGGAAAVDRALGSGGGGGFRRRAKGITGTELRGFRKVTNLLRKVGMKPKGLGGRSSSRRSCK